MRHFIAGVLACAALPLAAQIPQQPLDPQALALFQEKVQPLLKSKCQPCHNQRNRSSGLALDSRDAVVAGGNRGPAPR